MQPTQKVHFVNAGRSNASMGLALSPSETYTVKPARSSGWFWDEGNMRVERVKVYVLGPLLGQSARQVHRVIRGHFLVNLGSLWYHHHWCSPIPPCWKTPWLCWLPQLPVTLCTSPFWHWIVTLLMLIASSLFVRSQVSSSKEAVEDSICMVHCN